MTFTFTKHTVPCRGCGIRFRVDQEMLDLLRMGEKGASDAELALGCALCLACADVVKENPPGMVVQGVPGNGIYQEIPI